MTTTAQPRRIGEMLNTGPTEERTVDCPRGCGRTVAQQKIMTFWTPPICRECQAADDAREAHAAVDMARRQRRDDALKSLDVPLLYRDATLESFRIHGDDTNRHRQGRVMQLARRYLAMWPERQNLETLGQFPVVAIFRGQPGTGKGHVAWSIAKHVALEEYGRVIFTTLADCIRDLRDTWRRDADASESQRLAKYRKADLLVIDEVSAHAFYGEPTQHLYALVAYREERLLPTIITTNESPEGLSALLGPALESRAAGWNGVWNFGTADYRVERLNQIRIEEAA